MDQVTKAHKAMEKAAKAYMAFERKCEEHTPEGIAAYNKAEATRQAWIDALVATYAPK